MSQNEVQVIQASEQQMFCDASITVLNSKKGQKVQAISYQLANTSIQNQEYKIESINYLQSYRLLIDALETYASKPERKVILEEHSVFQIDETHKFYSYIQTFQDEITLPFNGNLKNQPIEIKNKVLEDLIEQLEDLHSNGLLVGYFNFSCLGLNKKLNKYMLLAFANLTLADDAMIRGSIDILRKSVRSSLLFQSMNKPIDYLSLLKNFLIAVSDFQDEQALSDKQLFLQLKDETFYFSDKSFGIAYSNQPCECRNYSPLKLCSHKTMKYEFSPKNPKIIENLKKNCLKQLENENKLLEFKKLRNDFKKKTNSITAQVTQLIEQIFESEKENTSVAQLLELRHQVSELLKQYPEYQKSEGEEKQSEQTIQNQELLDDIDQFIVLFQDCK